MQPTPVIAIIDVGKTNKKLFLFDENYRIVFERSARFSETVDEDGFPCENLESLRLSVFDSLRNVFSKKEFEIKAINFTTYGASLVYIDEEGFPVTPLYNYLKPYPEDLQKKFYRKYGGEEYFSRRTASPVLGSLNSGMQLYRIKSENREVFRKIKYALHLPQYMSYLVTGRPCSDLTSIGCHTNLWDFDIQDYHEWVEEEDILDVLAPIVPCDQVIPASFGKDYMVGVGLHDSSAALIPYLVSFQEPFVLISTGTWCITMNPFNDQPLTREELDQDCLCYLQYQGKPVKSSRLFAGKDHEDGIKRIADHFNQQSARYKSVDFNPELLGKLKATSVNTAGLKGKVVQESIFATRELSQFSNDIEAYHQLMMDIVSAQKVSTELVLNGNPIKRIFVDGGFGKNAIYMNLLAAAFPHMEVFAASMSQGTAVGAALCIHKAWNKKPVANDIIQLQYYAMTRNAIL
jgi:sugar (pentulose or hexulose) kinase